MKRIILTGGGTAGHVTPNIALLPRLKELGYDIQYIGSYTGIEKELIEPFGIPYHGISSGKLRRYFSVQNFTDPFRVLKGFREAHKLIRQLKPDVIFSKGGFVSAMIDPNWITTLNIFLNASFCWSLISSSTRIRCPVLLIGSHSVIPCTIPRIITFNASNILLLLLVQTVRLPSLLHLLHYFL